MNIGAIGCIIMSAFFAILGVVFFLLKEKGAILISGFNTLTKEQREQYDTVRMSKDQRNSFFVWTVIFILGAISSYFTSQYTAIAAFVIWLILFFREVHVDAEKAFAKYTK